MNVILCYYVKRCCYNFLIKGDNSLNIFDISCFREDEGEWKEEKKLEGHSDWVRDVAWAPSIGLPRSTIASCSQVFYHVDQNFI